MDQGYPEGCGGRSQSEGRRGSPRSGLPWRSDLLLPPAAQRRLWLRPGRSRLKVPSPTPELRRPLGTPDPFLLRKWVCRRKPQGAPRSLARTLLRGGSWRPAPGGGCWGGDGEGAWANRRALLRPPDVARLRMLQPWTAPRSASQVQGAAAEGGSAAGAALTARGRWEEGERGKRAPEEPTLLGQRLPGWLAGYRELQRSLNELALLA